MKEDIRQETCKYCNIKPATWIYGPDGWLACDDCVPRGCGCNQYPKDDNWDNADPNNWVDDVDEQGRNFPCCEWSEL